MLICCLLFVFSANAEEQRLEFVDGGVIHGELIGLRADGVLKWSHPDALEPVELDASQVTQVVYPARTDAPVADHENSLVRFVNGDSIHAKLLSLSESKVDMDTWFAGKVSASREHLASLTLLAGGGRVLYAGPMKNDHWRSGAMPMRWRVSEGMLTATNSGYIARDFILPQKVRIEFDAQWSGPFAMLMGLFSEDIQSFNVRNGYRFSLGATSASLQRMEVGQPTKYIGQVRYTEDPLGTEAKFEFRCDRATGVVHLIVDGNVIQTFEDPMGFPGRGGAISFYWQRAGAPLKITGFRISEWNGVMEDLIQPEGDDAQNRVRLVNKDSFEGKVVSIDGDKARIKSLFMEVDVPVERISHMVFSPLLTNHVTLAKGEVRAWFSNRGSISMQVDGFRDDRLIGANPSLGKVELNTHWLDRLQFNPLPEKDEIMTRLPEIIDPHWPAE